MNRGGRQGTMMELERRTQQIKEIVRVSAALRADMPPEAICALVAQTIHTTLGFRAAVVNLIVPGVRHFVIAATAGISDAERQRLINDPPPVDHIVSLMHEDFLVSRSYFISHEHKYLLEGAGGIMLLTPSAIAASRGPNSWHPDDVFFVPLISTRENRLLGIISLDLPEDGKVPTYDTAEVVELLANQAATALDTARLFQQRNQEQQAMERGLADLLAHLERMRQRDLSTRAQLRATALNQVASALNDVSETVGNMLADMRDASTVIQQRANEMGYAASHLVESAQRQAGQIRSVSEAVQHTAVKMHQIAERASDSSAIAEEAESISNDGREVAQQAGEGMNAVREITLQASKRIKRLGESSQEISQVVQLVSEFASQTHLLALNAAIEAANAGEHGTGFAIVAREIRTLAQNSNDATKQIHARIKGIQNETNQVAVTIEHATQQVVLLSDMVSRSGAALHTIANVIQRVISVIATMHQTAEEQANAAVTISGTMANIADITRTTWESAEHMRASTDRLIELATALQAKIQRFRLNERLQSEAPITAFPTQPPAAAAHASSPGSVSASNTPQPAASFATSFPRVTFQTRPLTGAPAPDPLASSTTPATPTQFANQSTPGGGAMEMLETVPMPALRVSSETSVSPIPQVPSSVPSMPPTPQRAADSAPLAPAEIRAETTEATPAVSPDMENGMENGMENVEQDATRPAIPTPQRGESTALSDAPTPPSLFPMSSSPLTPLRLAALEHTDETAALGASGAHQAAHAEHTGNGEGNPQAGHTADAGILQALPDSGDAPDMMPPADSGTSGADADEMPAAEPEATDASASADTAADIPSDEAESEAISGEIPGA